ncbi:hypothetical protein M0813_28378 [Anaeramoeba flamelloides]|uniref:Uncharacterized protein n=1 Tax=Anaeramoeba flamelloides TaxID=1746091 RepID=A0ABQ8XVH8_9EUKA|nr:hypothetical protein M0813_28378 [Anaeramoeba flamelloides]
MNQESIKFKAIPQSTSLGSNIDFHVSFEINKATPSLELIFLFIGDYSNQKYTFQLGTKTLTNLSLGSHDYKYTFKNNCLEEFKSNLEFLANVAVYQLQFHNKSIQNSKPILKNIVLNVKIENTKLIQEVWK